MDGSNAASLPTCILEEIGFEGLEGITVEGLWKRIGVRLKLMPLPLNKRLRNDIWKFVQNAKCLQYYELPEEREPLKLFDRSEVMDPFFGVPEPVSIFSVLCLSDCFEYFDLFFYFICTIGNMSIQFVQIQSNQ